MKKVSLITSILLIAISISGAVFATSNESNIQIEILSPNGVKDFPGHEDKVVAIIKNIGNYDLKNLLAYITMADLGKNMTVNLEDYGADKPVTIDVLKAGEEKTVELPIRFVYTSKYHLYVTLVSKNNNIISSSSAIPIEILGNTKINKAYAMGLAFIEPLLLISIAALTYNIRKRKFQVG